MAKKRPEQRSPKNKERKEPGFRTIGIRSSEAFLSWLDAAARHDRVSIAAFVEKAVIKHARDVGYDKSAPERIP